MQEFNIEFVHYYINTDNFKQKDADILINTINNSRLYEFMRFNNYAHISFEDNDKLHKNAHIEELEKFNRLKTNCLIFDLIQTAANNIIYDKCFIYRSNNSRESTYGFVFLNTKTGKSSHVYNIEETHDGLCIELTKRFNYMFYLPLYDHYNRKIDANKNRNGLTKLDCPTIKDYKKVIEEIENQVYKSA